MGVLGMAFFYDADMPDAEQPDDDNEDEYSWNWVWSTGQGIIGI